MIDGVKRRESLAYLRQPEPIVFPAEIEPVPTSQEAVNEFLNNSKPQRYAALALSIGELLTEVDLSKSLKRRPNVINRLPSTQFNELRMDAMAVFMNALEVVENAEFFKRAAAFTESAGELAPDRHTDLYLQLLAGSDTAVSSMVKLLAELPSMVDFHAPEQARVNYGEVARNSVGLPWKLAMMSVDQLMAARTALADENADMPWAASSVRLNPAYFKPQWVDGTIRSFKFADLESLELPKGYTPIPTMIPPLQNPTKIGDIGKSKEPVIGCPLTLLDKQLHSIWNWLIDAAEERELW